MNGQMIGRRQIRTNWAVRRFDGGEENFMKSPTYDNIFNATHAANTSVYVGGISSATTGKLSTGHLANCTDRIDASRCLRHAITNCLN